MEGVTDLESFESWDLMALQWLEEASFFFLDLVENVATVRAEREPKATLWACAAID